MQSIHGDEEMALPNTTAPTELSSPPPPQLSTQSPQLSSWVVWSRYPHSLEDEGHRLLPVLPLERQGPCEHLEL